MLVIPFDRPLDWRRPPVVTLLLIAVNALVYFAFQSSDQARIEEAVSFYYDSGLHAHELPRYRDVLRERGEQAFLDDWEEELAEPGSPWLSAMLRDGPYMQSLRGGQVITQAAPEYGEWRGLRAEFEARLAKVTSFAWGFRPAEPSVATVLTHMFLHSGLGHLLGNMFFLFAVGFLVEGALGRPSYLGGYLIGGLTAVGLYWLFHRDSGIPLVGASGAVAALMGMYAVLFGRRRISFFYYVGVYFDYVKAPALSLLALWLGYELLQYFWLAPDSSVAYMAHVGGLLGGAAIALGFKRLAGVVDTDYLEENERKADREALREQAAAHMQSLDFDKAVPLLIELLQEAPEERELLDGLLACTRFRPESEAYHDAVYRVFRLPPQNAAGESWIAQTFRDYARDARPRVRLSATLVRSLAARFTRAGEWDEAERLLSLMQRNPKAFPDAPAALARLAHALRRAGQLPRAERHFQHLLERHPDSPEARAARRTAT